MSRVLIVYCSTFGGTKAMAEAVLEGARTVPGAEAELATTDDASIDAVRACDTLILGSPIRHRSADSRMKAFVERTLEVLWLTDELVGRVGGVFSVGGGYGNAGAGVDVMQLGLLAAMAASGMVIVPLPKTTPGSGVAGSHWGAHGRTGGPAMEPQGVTDEMRTAAFHHGANVARVGLRLSGAEVFARGNVAPSPELVKLFQQMDPG